MGDSNYAQNGTAKTHDSDDYFGEEQQSADLESVVGDGDTTSSSSTTQFGDNVAFFTHSNERKGERIIVIVIISASTKQFI